MPFGTFSVSPKPRRPKAPKPQPAPPPPAPAPTPEPTRFGPAPNIDCIRLNILLIGRNLPILQEFLCAMNQNMSESLHGEGMSFYTRDLTSISDVVAKKKRLEQFFWTFSQQDWTYPQEAETPRTYDFSISPAGVQTKAVDLVFHCVTPQMGVPLNWQGNDAVWIVTDGALLGESALGDGYLSYVREVLQGLPPQAGREGKPICLVLSQIEKLARFDGSGGRSELSAAARRDLRERCRAFFGDPAAPVALLPVQVYGGMEWVGMDEFGAPRLHISQSGAYQSYIPDNCQIPGLYTLQTVAAKRQTDFFSGTPEGGFLKGVRHCYGLKFGDPNWAPDILGGEEARG